MAFWPSPFMVKLYVNLPCTLSGISAINKIVHLTIQICVLNFTIKPSSKHQFNHTYSQHKCNLYPIYKWFYVVYGKTAIIYFCSGYFLYTTVKSSVFSFILRHIRPVCSGFILIPGGCLQSYTQNSVLSSCAVIFVFHQYIL